ncbi:MAG: ABC transporter permease, partial [Phaeodactylibacter sp.]|nr:ABC transporter permease [Phaeodactylibacter sp.]
MLTNYIKIALRSIQRQKGYAVINILGLAVGLTVSLLIFLWIQDERGIDQFHKDGDRIFRILTNIDTGNGGMMTWETAPYPLIDHLRENYPEVEDVAAYDRTNKMQFELGEQVFLEDGIYATAGFFRILNFPLVEGVPSSVFEQPKAVVISDRLAEKFFGPNWEGQAVGQTVSINGDKTYQVTGVFEPLANHSSLEFDFVLDQDALHHDDANGFPWGNFDSRILVKAQSGVSQTALAAKVKDIIREQNEYGDGVDLIVQPFGRMYLHGKFENGKEAGGRIEYVRLFGLAAVVLLIIACINFMNLSTARASKRAREVGVRKTIGADRRSLVLQFLVESALITGIGFVVAVALSRLLLPYFHEITGKQLVMDWTDPAFWWLLLGTAGLTALLAGSYPAFFLSSFSITNVLKGQLTSNLKSGSLRKGLVVFQFVLSALLVVGALVVQDQVDFIKNKQLGLNKENVLYFRTPPGAAEQQDAFKNELAQLPG